MKECIFKFSLCLLVLVMTLSVNGQNKKNEKARKNVAIEKENVKDSKSDLKKAKQNLSEAKVDSAVDYQNFKQEAEAKISVNKSKIAELKTKRANDDVDSREKYNKKVANLEEKNNKLQTKINNASNTKSVNWTSFKREFRHDMNEIGQAFKDLGVDNAK